MDPIEDSMPPKVNMEHIERDISKSKEHIQEIDHLHLAEIKDWIESPLTSQMKINLFLWEWEKVKERQIEALVCEAQLQLKFVEYRDIADLLYAFYKWQSALGKAWKSIFCNPHFFGGPSL